MAIRHKVVKPMFILCFLELFLLLYVMLLLLIFAGLISIWFMDKPIKMINDRYSFLWWLDNPITAIAIKINIAIHVNFVRPNYNL